MLQALKILFVILTLFALACSVLRIKSVWSFSRQEVSQEKQKKLAGQNQENLDHLKAILEDPFSNFKERSSIAVQFAELAEKTLNTEMKIDYLCRTLDALSSSLRKEPLRARTLVTWANVKQLLGSYHCNGDNTEGFESALTLAVNSNPIDQQALFNAALIYLWAGKKEMAYPYFKKVLELGSDSSKLQREFIYSLVSDAATMVSLIPARLPQTIDFTSYLLSQSGSSQIDSISKRKLWEFQAVALEEFVSRFNEGTIDAELYLDKLFALWKISKESALTPQLDRLFAKHYGEYGPKPLSNFFALRSQYSELEVVAAFRKADSRPEKSSLSGWGGVGNFALDNFFSSVGFYLPRKKTLRRIELHSGIRVDQQLQGFIRVFSSDDNTSWEDVTGVCTVEQIIFFGKSIVYIEMPGSTKRFWKVHYANSARNLQLNAPLFDLLRVLGIGALDG